MGTELQTAELNERQAEFVRLVAEKGLERDEAAIRVGFTADYGRKLCRNPAVASALHAAIRLQIETELAPLAYKVAREIIGDTNAPARVRADLSIKILDRAGHITPSKRESATAKPLSEMSQAELLAFIADNQAQIDKAEQQLGDRAIDVSPQVGAEQGAKPLSYMD